MVQGTAGVADFSVVVIMIAAQAVATVVVVRAFILFYACIFNNYY